MEINTYTIDDGKILVIEYSGIFIKSDLQNAINAYYTILSEKSPEYILVDSRNLDGRLSIVDNYINIQNVATRKDRNYRKMALVEKVEEKDYAEFYETAAANVGYNVKAFFDFDQALNWLRS